MGIIRAGILGGVSGKVGSVVGASWKGIDYVRMLPRPSSVAPTEGQLISRGKLALALIFAQAAGNFVRVGFKSYAIRMSAFNKALSVLISSAIGGAYPLLTYSFATAQVSKGTLTPPAEATAVLAGNIVTLTWADNSGFFGSNALDKAMILVLNGETMQAVYNTDAATRAAGTDTIEIPAEWLAGDSHVYLAFQTAEGNQQSDSVYVDNI